MKSKNEGGHIVRSEDEEDHAVKIVRRSSRGVRNKYDKEHEVKIKNSRRMKAVSKASLGQKDEDDESLGSKISGLVNGHTPSRGQ